MDKNVCLRLKEERSNKNVTQKAIAKVTDVSEKTVGRWENGTPIPSDKLTLLSDLGLDVLYILTGARSNASLVGRIDSGLSHEHKKLIEQYEQLNPAGKEAIIVMMKALLGVTPPPEEKRKEVTNISPDNTSNKGYINQGNHEGDLSFGQS